MQLIRPYCTAPSQTYNKILIKEKKLIIFITGLHNKPDDCGASVASAAGPFSIKKYGK
jgi:hypothetical protein